MLVSACPTTSSWTFFLDFGSCFRFCMLLFARFSFLHYYLYFKSCLHTWIFNIKRRCFLNESSQMLYALSSLACTISLLCQILYFLFFCTCFLTFLLSIFLSSSRRVALSPCVSLSHFAISFIALTMHSVSFTSDAFCKVLHHLHLFTIFKLIFDA